MKLGPLPQGDLPPERVRAVAARLLEGAPGVRPRSPASHTSPTCGARSPFGRVCAEAPHSSAEPHRTAHGVTFAHQATCAGCGSVMTERSREPDRSRCALPADAACSCRSCRVQTGRCGDCGALR